MAKTDIEKLLAAVSVKGSDFVERKKEIVKLSPSLNYVLGGGLTQGSFTLISGAHKVGKTAASLYICKQAQKLLDYEVVYLNGEHRITERDLRSTRGLNLDNVDIITSSKEKIVYAEDFVNIARNKLESKEKVIVIADSLSQMCPRELAEKADIGEKYRDPTPKILSNLTKVLAPILSVTNNMFMAIIHTIADTSGRGHGGKVESGGFKIQYAHDFKLQGLFSRSWEDKAGNEIGKEIHWTCGASALGPPKRKCPGYLRYNHGIDEEMEILELAKLAQIPNLSLSGSWWKIFDQKVQGAEKAVELLKKDRSLFESIEKEVWEVLGDKTSFGETDDDGTEPEDVSDSSE